MVYQYVHPTMKNLVECSSDWKHRFRRLTQMLFGHEFCISMDESESVLSDIE